MENVRDYLDATYLKTPEQAGISESENNGRVMALVQEAIHQKYKLVMIRPDRVAQAREIIDAAGSNVLIGTVIDFPEGAGTVEYKLSQAYEAMSNGADELDFVVDYTAYIDGKTNKVADEVLKCTSVCLEHGKVVKWIIEIAALTDVQIAGITSFIREVITKNFEEEAWQKVFVKSSTGFCETKEGKPNGATPHGVRIMLDNAGPLPVKAAGGVRNYEEALAMINLGVKRIGTSSAKEITLGLQAKEGY